MYVTPQRKMFARKGKIKSELEAENSFREFYREKKWKRELGSMVKRMMLKMTKIAAGFV